MDALWLVAAADSPGVGVSLLRKSVNPWLMVLVAIDLHLIKYIVLFMVYCLLQGGLYARIRSRSILWRSAALFST